MSPSCTVERIEVIKPMRLAQTPRAAIPLRVTQSVWEFALRLPRNAFTSREVPRAGDVWRLCQDAATLASVRAGWPPARFRDEGVFFVVYRTVVIHESEVPYGEVLDATTWVSRLRRRTLSTREVRLRIAGKLVAAATQEWVHVDGSNFKPKQGSEETAAAFPAVDLEPSVKMPKFDECPGGHSVFEFEMWQTWADPLAHANHPAYVDWCDEATSRRMKQAGIEPSLLRSVAEQVTFRDSVLPGEQVTLRTERVGVIGQNAVVLRHHVQTDRGPAADATTIRSLAAPSSAPLIAAWD